MQCEILRSFFRPLTPCLQAGMSSVRSHQWSGPGETATTHMPFAGLIVDKEEEDKIMATGKGCNTCPCPKEDYLNPGKVYHLKSSTDILKAVLKAACDPLPGMPPGHLIARDAAGNRDQKGNQRVYDRHKDQARGVHQMYNPFLEIVHTNINQLVSAYVGYKHVRQAHQTCSAHALHIHKTCTTYSQNKLETCMEHYQNIIETLLFCSFSLTPCTWPTRECSCSQSAQLW